MQDIHQLEQEKSDLQEDLNKLKKGKFKFLIKPLILFPVFTFVLPLIPLKGESMAERTGRENSFIILGTFFLVVLIWTTIQKINEYKANKFDIETGIDLLESRITRLKE